MKVQLKLTAIVLAVAALNIGQASAAARLCFAMRDVKGIVAVSGANTSWTKFQCEVPDGDGNGPAPQHTLNQLSELGWHVASMTVMDGDLAIIIEK